MVQDVYLFSANIMAAFVYLLYDGIKCINVLHLRPIMVAKRNFTFFLIA